MTLLGGKHLCRFAINNQSMVKRHTNNMSSIGIAPSTDDVVQICNTQMSGSLKKIIFFSISIRIAIIEPDTMLTDDRIEH